MKDFNFTIMCFTDLMFTIKIYRNLYWFHFVLWNSLLHNLLLTCSSTLEQQNYGTFYCELFKGIALDMIFKFLWKSNKICEIMTTELIIHSILRVIESSCIVLYYTRILNEFYPYWNYINYSMCAYFKIVRIDNRAVQWMMSQHRFILLKDL